jgi:pyruvate dehydrogenase E2 component (dihydrolipoamide acetyltransferase)
MPTLEVLVPEEIGGVEECVVVTWLKRAGDPVRQGELLLVLQAEKVSIEVATPAAGKVVAILAQQGEVVKKGQVLAQLEVTVLEEAPPPAPAEPVAEATAPPRLVREVRASPIAKRLAREHKVDLALLTGSGAGGRVTEKDVLAFVDTRQPKIGPPSAPARGVRASPVARRLAQEHKVDLAGLTGSGAGGRVTEKDVLAFIEAQPARPSPEEEREILPDSSQVETLPLVGMRGAIARRMHDSLQSMAQLTLHTEADVSDLVVLYERLKQQASITYTDLIARSCALALRQHPQLNATLEGELIRRLPQINLGLAVALDDGLVVPVITEADRKSLAGLAQTRRRLVERARAGQLTVEEMSGGSFTVTNLGGYDIDGFTPIINPPEAAILGVGRIVEKVVIYQGRVAQRAMLTLSLTFDHRLVDGAAAAAFLQTIKRLLEMPTQLE